MRRSACHKATVAAAIIAVEAVLLIPPLAATIFFSGNHPALGPTAASHRTRSGATAVGRHLRGRLLRERWLECNAEEQLAQRVWPSSSKTPSLSTDISFHATSAALIDLSGRHLAWHLAGTDYAPSVHPMRC